MVSFLNSCAVEDLSKHEHDDTIVGIKSQKISFANFQKNTKAINYLNEHLKKKDVPHLAHGRMIYDTIRNFSIDTAEGLYLEYANLHSYTFPVKRDIDNGKLENLVTAYQNDGTYKVSLIIYDLTLQEENALAMGTLTDITNSIVTIPLSGDSEPTTEAMSCSETTEVIYVRCSAGTCTYANGSSTGQNCEYFTTGTGIPLPLLPLQK